MQISPMDDPKAIPDSYWAATALPLPSGIPDFSGKMQADVAVIGGGFTGLSFAFFLAQRGHDVLVVDANEPGWGASGRNNGQVVAALKHEPHEMEQAFGKDRGRRFIDLIGRAPDIVFDLIERFAIECNPQRHGIITAAHSPEILEKLRRRTDVWQSLGAPLEFLTREQIAARSGSSYYLGGCFDPRGGGINPLAYARGLAGAVLHVGGRIVRNAPVQRVLRTEGGYRLELPNGTVDAARVVIATNAYTGDFWPGLKRTFIPVRTPQLVSDPLPEDMLRDVLPGGELMSDLRRLMLGVRIEPGNRLHLGGGGGTSGANRDAPFNNMMRLCEQVYPKLRNVPWAYRWTGFMAMTPDSYPRLFELAPDVVALLGYSGRGIGTATVLGQELARWASGEVSLGDLALPVSTYHELPYYPIKEVLVEMAIKYYSFRDKTVHMMSHSRIGGQ